MKCIIDLLMFLILVKKICEKLFLREIERKIKLKSTFNIPSKCTLLYMSK